MKFAMMQCVQDQPHLPYGASEMQMHRSGGARAPLSEKVKVVNLDIRDCVVTTEVLCTTAQQGLGVALKCPSCSHLFISEAIICSISRAKTSDCSDRLGPAASDLGGSCLPDGQGTQIDTCKSAG